MLSFTHYKQCVQQINAVIFTGTLGPVSMDKSIQMNLPSWKPKFKFRRTPKWNKNKGFKLSIGILSAPSIITVDLHRTKFDSHIAKRLHEHNNWQYPK